MEVVLHVDALGYERKETQAGVSFGARTPSAIELVSADPAPQLAKLRFHARFEGSSSPFSGTLGMSIWQHEVRGQYSDRVIFKDGISEREYTLPIGKYMASVAGWGTHGDWWSSPCERFTFEVVPQPGAQRCSIVLRGGRIRLTVAAPDGRQVRGYGLDVLGESEAGGMWINWDRPDLYAEGTRDATPWVWMGPGPARVRVNLPGMGLGEADVVVPGDGSSTDVHVELREGTQIER